MSSMAAAHSIWPKEKDIIFGLAGRANEAKSKLGKENVIDATIGALMNDDGSIVAFDTVYDELKNLGKSEISPYSALEGDTTYLEKVKYACFKDYMPEGYIKSIASPGGSGAVKLGVFNYTNPGDKVMTADWCWSSYPKISEEAGLNLIYYKLFDENNNFNFNSYKKTFLNIANEQDRIFTIFNTPAHNPTGYSLKDNEWDEIIDLAKKVAENKEKKVIFLVDVAYIDYAGNDAESRGFFRKFSNLPENILILIAYSMSKSFTAYGMRMGAIICISSNEDVAEEFYYSCSHSCRANWSACNTSAMRLLVNIISDNRKLEKYEKEKQGYKDMLEKRGRVFVEEAKKVGLVTRPYTMGFFISIPCENPTDVVEEMIKENLFAVPMEKGIRYAICSVSEEECRLSPKIIKKAIDSQLVKSSN